MGNDWGYKNRADQAERLIDGLSDTEAAGGKPGTGPKATVVPTPKSPASSPLTPDVPIGDPLTQPVEQLPRRVAAVIKGQLPPGSGSDDFTTEILELTPTTQPDEDPTKALLYLDEDDDELEIIFPTSLGGGRARIAIDWDDDPVDITTLTLPNGTVGTAYNQTLAATGGSGTLVWSVVSGALPTGLSLNATTGAITGTPTADATFNFTVKAMGGGSDTQALAVIVDPAAPVAYYPVNQGTPGNTDGHMRASGTNSAAYATAFANARNQDANLGHAIGSLLLEMGVTPGGGATHSVTLDRGILRFDTTAFVGPAVSAIVRLTVQSLADAGDTFPIETSDPGFAITGQALRLVVWPRGVPAAAMSGVDDSADWTLLTAPVLASADSATLATIANDDTVDFALNAAGLAAIEAGDFSCFGLIFESDRTSTVPTGNFVDNSYVYLLFYAITDSGAGDYVAPALLVTV